MTSETWNAILFVLVIVLAGFTTYMLYRKGGAVTPSAVLSAIEMVQPVALELQAAAQMVVNDIEQIRRDPNSGIPNDVAFERAFNNLHRWYPDLMQGVTKEQAIAAINGAILVASQISNSIRAAKNAYFGEVLTSDLK